MTPNTKHHLVLNVKNIQANYYSILAIKRKLNANAIFTLIIYITIINLEYNTN